MSRFRGGVAAILVGGAIAGGIITQTGGGGGACAFPSCFPDATNTGVPAGTSLTAYSGPTNITTNNTVIDSKNVTSCLDINATGVIIKNSHLQCVTDVIDAPVQCDDGGVGSCGNLTPVPAVTIQDSEITCGGDTGGQDGGGHGLMFSNMTVRRANIHGCADGIFVDSDADIQDSFIHNLNNDSTPFPGSPDGVHADGIQLGDGHGGSATNGALNITIKHNTIEGMGYDPNSTAGCPGADCHVTFGTSAIISSHHEDTNIDIEQNLLSGGSNTIYCNNTDSGGTVDVGVNVRVKDNHFSTKFSPRVAVASGYYGATINGLPTTGCANETGTGNNTGNVIHETSAAYTLDTVP